MKDERGNWYLVTGLLLGIGLGLIYAWLLSPVEYTHTAPSSLRADYKQEYIYQIAVAYAATKDMARAQARLTLLKDPQLSVSLAALAQRALAENRPENIVEALSVLSQSVPQNSPEAVTFIPVTPSPGLSPTPAPTTALPSATSSPRPTHTYTLPPEIPTTSTRPASTPSQTNPPSFTPTFFPSRTPTLTQASLFVLDSRNLLCNPDIVPPLIIVHIRLKSGQEVPGVEIVVSWAAGEDHFFTGLKPEMGLGYADFAMNPGEVYTLRLADGSQRLTELTIPACTTADGQQISGSWELNFIQP